MRACVRACRCVYVYVHVINPVLSAHMWHGVCQGAPLSGWPGRPAAAGPLCAWGGVDRATCMEKRVLDEGFVAVGDCNHDWGCQIGFIKFAIIIPVNCKKISRLTKYAG